MRIPESIIITAVFLTGILIANQLPAWREAAPPAGATACQMPADAQ